MRSTTRQAPGAGQHRDASVTAEAWLDLTRVEGRDHLAHLVTVVRRHAEQHVERAVRRILVRGDGQGDGEVPRRDELWRLTHRNVEDVLNAMIRRRVLVEEELASHRELGRRRAQQGRGIDDVVRSLRIGWTVLWDALTNTASDLGPAYTHALLRSAPQVWTMFDQAGSAMADAHREAAITRRVDRDSRSISFLHRIRRLPHDVAAAEHLARELGLDASGGITVAVTSASGLPALADVDVVVEEPDRTFIFSCCHGNPSEGEARLGQAVTRHAAGPVGVGVTRPGLLGAQQSLQDAEWAHHMAVSLDRPLVMFRDSWLASLALQHSTQLAVLVEPALQALDQDPELCETLEAFLAADGNLTATGKALYVHANTVGYRLRQFARRTGVDARTVAGKALVQIALTYTAGGRPA